jgi:hypothetical protein
MNSIGSVVVTPSLPLGPGGGPASVATSAVVTLLPPPLPLDRMQDVLSQLQAILSTSRTQSLTRSETSVRTNQASRREAEHARDEALERAREESESEGLFDWITKDIGLIGLVGLLTLNPALVVADLVAHKTGIVDNLRLDVVDVAVVAFGMPALLAADILLRKLECTPDCVRETLDELGLGSSVPGISDEDVQPIVDKALVINLLILSAAVTVATAGTTAALVVGGLALGLSCGSLVSAWAGGPEELTLGLAIGGAALSLGSGLASSAASTAARGAGAASARAALSPRLADLKLVSSALSGANAAIQGMDGVLSAVHTKNADEARDQATQARQTLTQLERLLDCILHGLKDAKDSAERTNELIQSALETHRQTLRFTSAMVMA